MVLENQVESDASRGWEKLSGCFRVVDDGFTQLKWLLSISECIKSWNSTQSEQMWKDIDSVTENLILQPWGQHFITQTTLLLDCGIAQLC